MVTLVVFAITAAVASTSICESILCGVGIATGVYVASRTKKTSAIPKKIR